VIYRTIYRPISGNLSGDISNISRFLLQTIWRTIFPYRIDSRQKRRYRTISRPYRPIFKTGPKTMLGTTVKLNYLLWAQAFRISIGVQNKLTHLLQPPPADMDPTNVTWLTGDYSVMTWLLNSLEKKISGSIMFLHTAKDMLMWNGVRKSVMQ